MTLQRHPANPIIPVVPGTWRNFVTANADVVRVGDEWRLYFRGNSKLENGVANGRIGLLTCPVENFDGVTWQEYAGNPVSHPGKASTSGERGDGLPRAGCNGSLSRRPRRQGYRPGKPM